MGAAAASAAMARAGSFPAAGLEANHGQADSRVKFLYRGGRYDLFLTAGEAVFASNKSAVRMRLAGANRAAEVQGLDPMPGKSHYLIGSDAAKWWRHIPVYARVAYRAVRPGVDLVYYPSQGQVEYDLILSPGAEPASIEIE